MMIVILMVYSALASLKSIARKAGIDPKDMRTFTPKQIAESQLMRKQNPGIQKVIDGLPMHGGINKLQLPSLNEKLHVLYSPDALKRMDYEAMKVHMNAVRGEQTFFGKIIPFHNNIHKDHKVLKDHLNSLGRYGKPFSEKPWVKVLGQVTVPAAILGLGWYLNTVFSQNPENKKKLADDDKALPPDAPTSGLGPAKIDNPVPTTPQGSTMVGNPIPDSTIPSSPLSPVGQQVPAPAAELQKAKAPVSSSASISSSPSAQQPAVDLQKQKDPVSGLQAPPVQKATNSVTPTAGQAVKANTTPINAQSPPAQQVVAPPAGQPQPATKPSSSNIPPAPVS